MKNQLSKIFSFLFAFVLLSCPILHLFANAVTVTNETIASKLDGAVLSAFDDGTQKVKVYVWINDINQTQINKAVEQKTGLRADNLAVIEENISNDLAIRITSEADRDSLSTETEKMLQAYLDRTAAQRTQERERTDLYLSTRRAESKAKYNEQSAAFLAKNALSSEKVIFNSNYAPMLILELTKQEIVAIAEQNNVTSIEFCSDDVIVDLGVFDDDFEKNGIERIKNVSGLSGAGVRIGIAEAFGVADTAENMSAMFGDRLVNVDGHTTGINNHSGIVAYIAAGNAGVANDALVYTTGISGQEYSPSQESYPAQNYYQRIEELITLGTNVINSSFGSLLTSTPNYTSKAKWLDHIASTHGVTFVQAAGKAKETVNYFADVALAENVITVGSYHVVENTNVLAAYSPYDNGNGVCKPDIVAYGNFFGCEGTSFAAPLVTGTVALLLELRPFLAIYPHLIKAIVMASCHDKADHSNVSIAQETMTMGITNAQGAGMFNAYVAVAIASYGTFGFGIISEDEVEKVIMLQQVIPDFHGMNVSLTWLRDNTIANSHINGAVNTASHCELSLQLTDSFDEPLVTANNSNTSTEMVYYSGNIRNTKIHILSEDNNVGDVRFAYAWSVDNVRFQYTQSFEGVGLLCNANNGKYLQYDSDSQLVVLNSEATFYQSWIIQNNANTNSYKITFAHDTIGSLSVGEQNLATINGINVQNVSVQLNDDGTYSFIYEDNLSTYALGSYDATTYPGQRVIWASYSGTVADNQKWYFYRSVYERGDVDLDYSVTASDARLILRYSTGSENLTALQAYLADVDGSGRVRASDARIAERYAVGLDP